ncbi:tetratricopeptide repeat protein [Permianibacter sp. IMCC34836]|uniref:tetratricopeptide repeat protein n=1 Tax=Permianibacter fluminis TaxID=2738515 RepID=UPI001557CB24|nr:tetratricopeptide repeat protein [Permianibacter fluminis]NQD36777.1 tetratricopeptide repeat protein [Permianibacter fluminis]
MLMKLLSELRRRNVIKTLAIYTGVVLATLETVSALFPMLNLPPIYATVVAIALLAGFPVVFYISWFFELTDEGLKRTAPSEEAAVTTLGLAQWFGLMVILIGSVLIAYLLYTRIAADMARTAEGQSKVAVAPSIAVLPFRDQSPERDQGYFAEGLAEELTSLLGQRPGLQVAAASSSFITASKGMTPVDAGKSLGVATVLTGSIVVAGDRLKVIVELVDATDGKTLWTQSFSRTLSDMFVMQEEIARSVANLLEDVYLEAGAVKSSAKTASSDAYVLYLKGREQYRKQTTEAMKDARKLFEQAIGVDPEYAQAYVGLADSLVLLASGKSKLGILDPGIAASLAEQNLAKALVRAPELADAYAIQGKVFELQQKVDEVIPAYDKALSLNPNLAIAHMWKYLALEKAGRHIDALDSLEHAYRLDPLSVTTMFNRAFELSRRGRFAEARQQFEQLIDQYPSSPMGHQGLADAAFRNGELALSLAHWHKAMLISPDNVNFQQAYVSMLLMLGLLDEAKPLATDSYYTATRLLLSGDYPALFKEMAFQLQANPDDPWVAFEAGWYEYLVGDANRGQQLLLQALPELSQTDLLSAPMPMCSPGIEIAYALQQAGRQAEADALVQACAGRLTDGVSQGIVDMQQSYLSVRIEALKGNDEAALTALELAFSQGWREWWTARDPVLSRIRALPRAQAVFQQIQAAVATERDKAKALVLNEIAGKKS